MNKKVQILMSTYNGEKYLDEQLKSIFSQAGVDVDVLVRDDGSNDLTLEILEKWSKNYRLEYYRDANLGPQKSFLALIKKAKNHDFYAFADQDDVWDSQKLITAISSITNNKPALFMSTYDVVDENLNSLFIRDMHFDEPFSVETTIMYRCPSGCTMVFNEQLCAVLRVTDPDYVRMHDFWTLLVALMVDADIITDSTPLLKYRQHSNNTVGFTKGGTLKKIKRLLLSTKNDNERKRQAVSLYDAFKLNTDVDSNKLASLKDITEYTNSFNKKIKILKSNNYRASSLKKNILFKVSVMLNQF